jgi:hypothetical protein
VRRDPLLAARDVHDLLATITAALEGGDHDRAHGLLLGAEGRVFLDGHEDVAAEMGFARHLLNRGDPAGALRAIRAVPSVRSGG